MDSMYIVIEIQRSENTVSTLVWSFNSLPEAQSKYHTVLAAAAISALPSHGAVLMMDNGYTIQRENFRGGVE